MYTINDLPASYKTYVIAREYDNRIWYWSTTDNYEDAHKEANRVNGAVYHRECIN